MSAEARTRRSGYKKITEEMRLSIIDRILDKGHSLKDVASELGINVSTCKAIIKVYQEEGRVGKKKRRNKVYNVIQTFSFFTVHQGKVEQIGDLKIEETKVSLQRQDNFDEILEEEARNKANQMLEDMNLQFPSLERNIQIQQEQFVHPMLWLPNGYVSYPWLSGMSILPQSPETVIKQEQNQENDPSPIVPKVEDTGNRYDAQ